MNIAVTKAPPRRQWLWFGLFAGAVITLMLLPLLVKREPMRLSVVKSARAGSSAPLASLCLSNCTSESIVFLSDGNHLPYYQLIEYIRLSTNPPAILVTNYNQQAFFNVRAFSLPAHGAITFPVTIPACATNPTIIVNYMKPHGMVNEMMEQAQILLGRRKAWPVQTYENLLLKLPID